MVKLLRSILLASIALAGSSLACPVKTTTASSSSSTTVSSSAATSSTQVPSSTTDVASTTSAVVTTPTADETTSEVTSTTPPASTSTAISSPANLDVASAQSMAKGTYPRATRLSDGSLLGVTSFGDGSLLGVTSFGDGSDSVIGAFSSTDDGTTWTEIGEVTRGASATHDISNQFPIQLSTGRILVAFRNHDKDSDGTYTFFRITVCYSDDGGKTWTYLSTPASDPGPVNGNWEPFMRLANDGTLQIYYSRENAANDQDSLMRTSSDGGVTWSDAQTISGADVTQRDGMLGVANYGGSNLLAIFETNPGGHFQVWSVTSADDGTTWGNRRPVYEPTAGGANAGAPQVVFVGNGTLVASFMTDEDAPTNGSWPAGAAIKVVTSQDGGASWTGPTTVYSSSPNSYWAGMYTLDSNTVLAMADQSGSQALKLSLS